MRIGGTRNVQEQTSYLEVEPVCSPRHPTGTWALPSEHRLFRFFVGMSFWAAVLKPAYCIRVSLSHRYKGNFSQSRVQLRAGRLRKPLWVPRKDCRPPPLKGLGPRRALQQASSETAGNGLLGGGSIQTGHTKAPGCWGCRMSRRWPSLPSGA